MYMEDKLERYLHKVVDFLVRDTKIDRSRATVKFPYEMKEVMPSYFPYGNFNVHSPPTFQDYCTNNYGLTKKEIVYVWDRYKNMMENKLRYGR
jgi:hypothetical protein